MKKIVLLSIILLLLVSSVALADVRTFKVAEGTFGEVPDKIFETLNNSGLKPAGWSFESPHANLGLPYAVNMAALTKTQLLNYDLIFFTNHTTNAFTDDQVSSLKEWISAGGTLWIDNCGDMNLSNFFLPLSFISYDGHSNDGSKVISSGYENYYFFNNVYPLTADEKKHLGHPGYSSTAIYGEGWNLLVSNRDGKDYADMLVRSYGNGRIIVTADDYGCGIYDSGNAEDIKLACQHSASGRQEKPPEPNPTPEPSTMLLIGLGLFGLAGFRKKMK